MNEVMETFAHGHTRLILGIPVRFESNAEEVMSAVARAYADWPATDAEPRVWIRMLLAESAADETTRLPIEFTFPAPDRVTFRTGHTLVDVDAGRRIALGRVTGAVLNDVEHFRYGLLEAATLFVLTTLDRIPFHASALVQGNRAVLLAGPSGVGKSSLVWAALRSDPTLQMLAEDCVFIQTQPESRIWGWPGFLHLSPDAAVFFEELRSREASLLANGKWKIALEARSRTAGPERSWTSAASVCLLRRDGGPPRLERLEPDEAGRRLFAAFEPGFDRFADRLPAAVRPFLLPNAWQVDPGPDPRQAVQLLREVLRLESEPQRAP
jgi:hypothetical protein